MSEFDFSKYRVSIDNEIDFYAQTVSHPGVSIATITQRYMETKILLAGDSISYEPLSISNVLDENWDVYFFLLSLMSDAKNDPEKLERKSIDVFCYNNSNNPIIQITYKNPILTQIGSIDLDSKNAENSKAPLSYTFEYENFSIKRL